MRLASICLFALLLPGQSRAQTAMSDIVAGIYQISIVDAERFGAVALPDLRQSFPEEIRARLRSCLGRIAAATGRAPTPVCLEEYGCKPGGSFGNSSSWAADLASVLDAGEWMSTPTAKAALLNVGGMQMFCIMDPTPCQRYATDLWTFMKPIATICD